MIKKIEHFWKGLGHDRTQISALPPDQYGDRFYKFIEGITLSAEEAARIALLKQEEEAAAAAAVAAAAAGDGNATQPSESTKHGPGFQSGRAPLVDESGDRPPPGAQAVVDHAEQEARRTELEGAREQEVPDRTRTAVQLTDWRRSTHDDATTVLPVVEEAGEVSTMGSTKIGGDKESLRDGPTTPPMPVLGLPPQTPPKDGYLKPDSADSGYAGHVPAKGYGTHTESLSRLSMESLNKALPPLPEAPRVAA